MLSLVFQDDDMVIVGRTSSRSRKSPIPDTITALLTQPVLTRIYNEYDHRGNLTRQLQEGIPVHSYAYNAMDRLAKAWSHTPDGAVQTEAVYHYNGLGQRVGKSRYTGAAGWTTGTMGQPADSMAAAMEENGTFHYYLQDEMGSPIRVSGYNSTDSMADGNHDATAAYLTYGYDEFGNDPARTIGKELEEDGIPSPYTMQGEGQPFGYTGYRYDTDSGTYFAQAREYQPQTGRFHAQDVIAGNGAVPVTLNRYGYCLGNPVGMVDLDGLFPISFKEWGDKIKKSLVQQIYDIKNVPVDGVGTVSLKASVNANILLGGYIDGGVSFDRYGNIAIQWSYAYPLDDDTNTASVGLFDIGACLGVAITDAKDVNGLLGPSSAAGFSGGLWEYLSVDAISFDDISDTNGQLDGFQAAYGKGAGVDVHLVKTYTKEVITINIYDWLLEKLGEESPNDNRSECIYDG